MALLDAREFADIACIKRTSLPAYEKRGKVVFIGTGKSKMYDTDNEVNKAFIQKMSSNAKKQTSVSSVIEVNAPVEVEAPVKRIKKNLKIEDEEQSVDGMPSYHVIERKLKYLDTLKREKEVELLKIKEQKLKGEVVPTELVAPILLQLNHNMMVELKNGMDEVIRLVAKKYDLTSSDISEFRKMVTNSINESAKNAVVASKKNLEVIIEQFSETRGIGERR